MNRFPTYESLMNPLIRALRGLGGSGSIQEIEEKVVELERFSEEVVAKLHAPEKSNQTELGYRLAWARTWLRKFGLLDNPERGFWSLTAKVESVDPFEVLRIVRAQDRERGPTATTSSGEPSNGPSDDRTTHEEEWKAKLHHILTTEINPGTFERLVLRVLRESGFVSVEVTGRTGDGGIAGRGIVRIPGLMSFHVVFQCKKYQRTVSADEIRDFRRPIVGRADKGLFLTTGRFTPEAVQEATRDGAPPIDLIDGDKLAEKLKDLRLGIECEMVERVSVDTDWFTGL